ncbi:hypothetical protein OSB04_018707 [Centaurea solstitialis]|uniref:Uncharacterized protein n=1 Tax=Centaurea solstitialis TaxID=347529 RepID=A0AA38WAR9_9ASTR|nr:hypothetical protein OSB04_018707 [Centaurea solstitialis]
MASSSSSSSPFSESWNHDVFLCFRGADTRMTFVDHLYSALVQQGISTYLFDQQTLPRGKAIGPSIFKAIEESRIAVIILSENFAGSLFCLNELAYIMKCKDERGKIVIPIFYHIDPSDVRKQRGSFGESFSRYEMQNMSVESWRKALTDVGNLAGWVTDQFNGYEAKQIQKIVDTISNILSPNKDRFEMGTHLKIPSQDMLLASSASSSSSSQLRNHDVFISFRGEDTRRTFVDHLYSALVQLGIYTYKDDETLDQGNAINPLLLKTIEESRIALIVFSKNYANSSWCLDELAYIMKCSDERGQIVIPIYYHLEPYEVRKQLGKYIEALAKHELENKNVESWWKAIVYVANLSGFIANGVHEARLVKEIVDTVSNELFSNKDQVESGTDHLKIPLQHILLAANKFSEANIIARSGFGKVYKGQSRRLGVVAIKKLDRLYGQGDREFMMEISLLSICKHENIVSLVGFCDESDEKILVYRYEKNGSLDRHLGSKDLTWMHRLWICIGAAHGLKYLHDDIGPHHRVIHRDVKSANILLDENWKSKISDFGLSKIALANVPFSALFSIPCGTPGYVDPEYKGQSTLSQKSDVYSFGVVLFEVLFGRAVIDAKHSDENRFSVEMAKSHYEEETLEEMIDADLRNQMRPDSLNLGFVGGGGGGGGVSIHRRQRTQPPSPPFSSPPVTHLHRPLLGNHRSREDDNKFRSGKDDNELRSATPVYVLNHIACFICVVLRIHPLLLNLFLSETYSWQLTVFSEANIIARSGFGMVYQGQSGRYGVVAIKQLDRMHGQGDREFMMEIALLSICKHDNIVSLVGFCDEDSEKILVYRYEKNRSVDKLLRSKDLTWMHRLRICLGSAFGLKYLHDDVGPQLRVLHRDVKSANILLDENWKPKISDFGLSKIALANVPLSALVSNPCGTPGYMDPQYMGHNTPIGLKMAKNHYEKRRLEEMIDADLRNQMKPASLSRFSSIAYECLKEHGEERPRMIQVIKQLVKALEYQQDDGPA